VSEFEEREYVKKVAGFKSTIEVHCMYCKTIYDHIDGRGNIGVSHGCCNDCLPVMKKAFDLCELES